jgi:hypothetical protein
MGGITMVGDWHEESLLNHCLQSLIFEPIRFDTVTNFKQEYLHGRRILERLISLGHIRISEGGRIFITNTGLFAELDEAMYQRIRTRQQKNSLPPYKVHPFSGIFKKYKRYPKSRIAESLKRLLDQKRIAVELQNKKRYYIIPSMDQKTDFFD